MVPSDVVAALLRPYVAPVAAMWWHPRRGVRMGNRRVAPATGNRRVAPATANVGGEAAPEFVRRSHDVVALLRPARPPTPAPHDAAAPPTML